VENRSHRQIAFEIFERFLDLGQLSWIGMRIALFILVRLGISAAIAILFLDR
jgi:hypothetical protein